MNLIIIGSKGFIGSYSLKYFTKIKDCNVYGCDVVIDYNTENYFLVDSTNADYKKIFSDIQFDVCINCSGAASVADSLKNPLRDFNLNTKNVLSLLDAIRVYSPKCKFINLSSAAVYGNPIGLPITESSSLSPISPYGIHKKQAEELCSYFYKVYGIATCSLRIFSAYGEGLRKQLFWDLAKKGQSKSSLSLFGTGNESRDFIHVFDIVSIIDLIIDKGRFNGEAINIANGEEVFIKDAVRIFYSEYDVDLQYAFSGNNRVGDPINWVADISTIKELGYKKSISLENGLSKYVKWIRELS